MATTRPKERTRSTTNALKVTAFDFSPTIVAFSDTTGATSTFIRRPSSN